MPSISEENCFHYITFKCTHGDENCNKKHDEGARATYQKLLAKKKDEYIQSMMKEMMPQEGSSPAKKKEDPS